MIKIINPTNGAPINDIFTDSAGKAWKIDLPKDTQLAIPEEVGNYLLDRFGFLEKGEEVDIQAREDGFMYCKNDCGFSSKVRVALLNHEKKCDALQSQKASYVRPVQLRSMAMGTSDDIQYGPTPGQKDSDGVEWYGDGFVDDNIGSMSTVGPVGVKGHFGIS